MVIETAGMGTPLGRAHVAVVEGRLVALALAGRWAAARARLATRFPGATFRAAPDPGGVMAMLGAYFDGDLAAIDRIAVDPGGTPFQRAVWDAVRGVPAGATVSYGVLAQRSRAVRAVRAVGAAMGANPIWIVQPCHRVVRSDGSLGGYGGGLHRKRWLIEHERAHVS